MNYFTQFAALVHILTQSGNMSASFGLSVIPEGELATQERTRIMDTLTAEERKYLLDYFNGDIIDATADELIEVSVGGEAWIGSIFIIYDDQGDILRVFATAV